MLVKPLVRPIVRAIAGRPTASIGGGFAPTSLFAANEPGYLYDLDDLSTLFLDSAGTTPATVNGLVGLVLDKSKGGVTGDERVPSGDYAGTVDGGFSFSGRTIVRNGTSINGARLTISPKPATATFYRVTMDVSGITGDTLIVRVGGISGAFQTITANGSYSFLIQSVGTSALLQVGGFSGTAGTATLSNISVKELPGNHAYQTTTGSKPLLRGTPVGSNLVTNGDFASGTGWTTGAGWAIGSGVATKTAGVASSLSSTVSLTTGKVYRLTATLTVTASIFELAVLGGATLVVRTVSSSGTYVSYFTATGNHTTFAVQTSSTSAGTIDNIEIVDVSAGSVTAPYALQYDGVDDFLQTAAVDFTATDKVTVCHGVRKLSDAAASTIIEFSANAATNAGAFVLFGPFLPSNDYGFRANGTTPQTASKTGYTSPVSSVLTGVANIVGDSTILRIDGVQQASVSADLGTGNFGNYALYFGRRGGTSLPYNGLMYSSVCIGRLLTAAELANVERWVARKTGVTL